MDSYGYAKHDLTKPSRSDWLGAVPSDWDIKKMKYLFRDHSQKGQPDATLLSVTQGQGVVPRTWVENRMVMPSGNLESFKFIEKDDFAISLRSFEGGLEYCHHSGIISPAYTVLKRRHADLDSGFYRHLFKCHAFISELQTSVVGIREGKNISFEELSYSLMPIPPLPEQRGIAAFLDDKCAKIDGAVKIKEDQIALLRERRQIIIQDAVTRGLNPAAPMKDSGIDWIAEIPSHWEIRKLKHLFKEKKHRPNMALNCGAISFGEVVKKDDERTPIATKASYQEVLAGEILVNPLNLNYDLKSLRIALSKINVVVSAGYIVLLSKTEIDKDYFKYLLHRYDVSYMKLLGSGVRQTISFNQIANNLLIAPPLSEQRAIAAFLDDKCAKIDAAVKIKEDQIAALKEYKTSLINAAVTGKIKVI